MAYYIQKRSYFESKIHLYRMQEITAAIFSLLIPMSLADVIDLYH